MSRGNKKKMSVGAKAAIWAAVGILCGVCGFGFGKLIRMFENSGGAENLKEAVKTAAVYVTPFLYLAVMPALFIIAGCRYAAVNRAYKRLGEDDEDRMMELEHKLNLPATLMNVCMILNFMFFSIVAEIIEFGNVSETFGKVLTIVTAILFVGSYVVLVIISRKCLMLVKKMNPEKRGDLLDMNFHKKWEESCDEAQKIIMYKAAYKAFKVTNYSCLALWLVCVLAQFVFHAGVFPVICVSAVWLIMISVYCAETSRLEK